MLWYLVGEFGVFVGCSEIGVLFWSLFGWVFSLEIFCVKLGFREKEKDVMCFFKGFRIEGYFGKIKIIEK